MTDLETRMNHLLERLGVPLHVIWCPDADNREHSRIDLENKIIVIYDEDEEEAMRSLFHEVFEYGI